MFICVMSRYCFVMSIAIMYVIFKFHVLEHMQFLDSALNKFLSNWILALLEEYIITIEHILVKFFNPLITEYTIVTYHSVTMLHYIYSNIPEVSTHCTTGILTQFSGSLCHSLYI